MLRTLVEKALKLRLAVLGLAAALAGIGAWSFANLPIDAFPDISTTQVKMILRAPGMTPEEVEARKAAGQTSTLSQILQDRSVAAAE